MRTLRLMIADDDANIREGLRLIIRDNAKWPYTVSEAENGQEALDGVLANGVDILVADIKMPLLNGIQLLESMKKAGCACEVIMLSGFDDYSYIRSALKLGAFDYLLKPVNVPMFLNVLENAREKCAEHGEMGGDVKQPPTPSVSHANIHIAFYDREAAPCEQFSPEAWLEPALEHAAALNRQRALEEMRSFLDACSPANMEAPRLRDILTQWVYRLMQKNNSYIEIVGRYKLTDHDVLNCVKSLPTISQLSDGFLETMALYIDELTARDKDSDAGFLRAVNEFLDENYSQDISLEAVSRKLYMHPNYFSAVFREKTGGSFREYRRAYLMQKAKVLLRDKRKGIGEISALLGYQDVSHFNRAFKSVTGQTPSRFRKGI